MKSSQQSRDKSRIDGLIRRNQEQLRIASAVFLIAVAVYLACAFWIGRPVIVRDAFAYNASAQRLINTGVFRYNVDDMTDVQSVQEPTAFTMPGYTLFLAGLYLLVPRNGDAVANMLSAQPLIIGVQLLLAALVPALLSLAGWRLGGRRLCWVTGILSTAYIQFALNATVSMGETLTLFLVTVLTMLTVEMFAGIARHAKSHPTRLLIAYGVIGGLATLVRPTILAWLAVPLAMWAYANRGNLKTALRLAGISLACIFAVLSPWIARNAISLREFIPLTATASTPLLDSVGGEKFTPAEEALMADARARGEDPMREVALDRIRRMWEIDPLRFITDRLGTTVAGLIMPTVLPVDIILELQSGSPQVGTFADSGKFLHRTSPEFTTAVFLMLAWTHRAVLLLAVLGLALGFRRRAIRVLALVPAYFAVVHTLTLVMVRYFYPTMPALLLLAAYGATGAAHLLRQRLRQA